MPWQVEQNTGVNDYCIRCVWWRGHIYAFTENAGVWRRDGVAPAPWTQVFAPAGGNRGGTAWLWEEDNGGQGAIYCGGGGAPGPGANQIFRSEDGTNWALDVDLNVAFGLQVSYNPWSVVGGYGDYLYVANYDVTVPTTFFYRRDLAGNWAVFGAPHAGAEGLGNHGVIGFGGEVYWTNATSARYWDGAAWSIEATLDAQGGTWLSVLDDILYVRTSTAYSLVGGYYWRTTAATEWAFLNLPVPDNTWGGWTLCQGEDGGIYAVAQNGTTLRIYQKVGPLLDLIAYQATVAPGLGTRGGVCTDATGAMYFGTNVAAAVQFFEFAGNYDVTSGGLYPQAVDCDGDGDALYIALYDTGTTFPLLVSVALPLVGGVSVGSNVFPAAAGTAINVKCTDIGDNVAVAGRFSVGGNDSVQVSGDAGLNWNDIAPNWGDTAQPLLVGPCTLDEVVVALDALLDLMETEDGGATWIQRNAAIGYSPGAMARLPGGDELVLGNDAAVRIDYSPNRGVTLANITGVVYAGNVAALEVA